MTENDIELSRPYAEELRGTMEAALKGLGQQDRSVDIQVGFVTNIIAQAVSEARSQAYAECAKIAEEWQETHDRDASIDIASAIRSKANQ